MSLNQHKKEAPNRVKIGIISVSTTRGIQEDKSGAWIKENASALGHSVVLHTVISDNIISISKTVTEAVENLNPDALILTGGTGISSSDVTIESVSRMFEKELPAFGAIFAQLSFQEIGSAAILSRAAAGLIKRSVVICIPGSLKACKLACKSLIFPELGHLTKHASE